MTSLFINLQIKMITNNKLKDQTASFKEAYISLLQGYLIFSVTLVYEIPAFGSGMDPGVFLLGERKSFW